MFYFVINFYKVLGKNKPIKVNVLKSYLQSWAKDNEMKINLRYTTFQVFILSTKPKNIELIYDGEKLQRSQEATYLEIATGIRLKWNKQTCKVNSIGNARNWLLKRLTNVKWGIPQDFLCATFKLYIRPAFENGSEFFITASEMVQNNIEFKIIPLKLSRGHIFYSNSDHANAN